MDIIRKEQLQYWNPAYDQMYGVTDSDVDFINFLRFLIREKRRMIPTAGDTIICCGPENVYTDGMVCGNVTEFSSICTQPMDPFVNSHCGDDLSFSVSGGYFFSIPPERVHKVESVGVRERWFWTWGHDGPEHHGGIHFPATTRVWRYCGEEIY